jgi:hypothetical protein
VEYGSEHWPVGFARQVDLAWQHVDLESGPLDSEVVGHLFKANPSTGKDRCIDRIKAYFQLRRRIDLGS